MEKYYSNELSQEDLVKTLPGILKNCSWNNPAQLMKEMENLNPAMKKEAEKMISSSTQYLPTKADVVAKKLAVGGAYTVKCWINETTTVQVRSGGASAPAPVKKVATKKIAPKKETLVASEAAPKVETKKSSPSQTSGKEGVKMLGILHLVGNLFSGGVLGIILVVLYLVIRKNELSQLEKETCYEIINFNLSFILYTFVAACSMILLIGFVLLPVVVITGLVLMVMGFLRHLVGENYKYPFIIRFVS